MPTVEIFPNKKKREGFGKIKSICMFGRERQFMAEIMLTCIWQYNKKIENA